MPMNANSVIVPGRGAVFVADPSTAAPAYKTITPDVPGAGWTCLGHTSKDNTVALSKDGGDATSYDTWWENGIAVTHEAITWSLTVNPLQIEVGVLDLAFGGTLDATDQGYLVPSQIEAVEKAVFVLALQGTARLGLYLPRVSITLGDAPTFDPTKLFEIPLSGSLLAGDDGNVMKWFHPALETAPEGD